MPRRPHEETRRPPRSTDRPRPPARRPLPPSPPPPPSERNLGFATPALSADVLRLVSLDGTESLSGLYEFELKLESDLPDLDSASIIDQRASVTLRLPGDVVRRFHGVVTEFEQLGIASGRTYSYRAVLAPRLWQLSLVHQSRVFLGKTVVQILGELLGSGADLIGEHENRISRVHAAKEFVVQYQESDLDFLCRWLENEGIYYYFKQTDDKDVVVFSDGAQGYDSLCTEGDSIAYSPTTAVQERITSLVVQRRRIPKEVVLQDYNWQLGTTVGLCTGQVDVSGGRGRGRHYEYGNHYESKADGDVLATVRAQEIFARETVHTGTGTCPRFRAGARYQLSGHFNVDLNGQEYVLLGVTHHAQQPPGQGATDRSTLIYSNTFTAILSQRTFRPPRETPWPRITGSMHAKIAGVEAGASAPVDAQGRYKVKLPFDLSDRAEGGASHWIRMSQPYAGKDFGMHFPLHVGTEVALSFLDGDPDRPIISGALNDPQHPSIIGAQNASTAGVRSYSGNVLGFHDTDGNTKVTIAAGNGGSAVSIGATKLGGLTKNQVSIFSTQYELFAAVLASQTSTINLQTALLKNIIISSPVVLPFLLVPVLSRSSDGTDPILGIKLKESDRANIEAANAVLFTLMNTALQVTLLGLAGAAAGRNAKLTLGGDANSIAETEWFVTTFVIGLISNLVGGRSLMGASISVGMGGALAKIETALGKNIGISTGAGSLWMYANNDAVLTALDRVRLQSKTISLDTLDLTNPAAKGGTIGIDASRALVQHDSKIKLIAGVGPLGLPAAAGLTLTGTKAEMQANVSEVAGLQAVKLLAGPAANTAKVVLNGVPGSVAIEGMTSIELKANTKISLVCGASKIEISPAGIEIVSGTASIKLSAAGEVKVKALTNLIMEGMVQASLKSAVQLKLEAPVMMGKSSAPMVWQ